MRVGVIVSVSERECVVKVASFHLHLRLFILRDNKEELLRARTNGRTPVVAIVVL